MKGLERNSSQYTYDTPTQTGVKQMKIYKGWKVILDCKQYEIIGTQSLRQSSYVILKDLQGNKSSMNRDAFLRMYSNKELSITQ